MYCVNGESGSSLLIESTDSMIDHCLKATIYIGYLHGGHTMMLVVYIILYVVPVIQCTQCT